MRWVVTGSGGQLGRCLVEQLAGDERETLVLALSHADLDIGDEAQVARLFDRLPEGAPDVLVNAAAFTAVDRCETESAQARRVNGEGPRLLAERCRADGVGFIHVSTDYVFDGKAHEPYRESDPVAPQTVYGQSKAEGERLVLGALPHALIVRTSWVFGPGRNFVAAILRQAALRRRGEVVGPLQVVDDQRGCPTYAGDLAAGIRALATRVRRAASPSAATASVSGIIHLANAGSVTWWDFARRILDVSGYGDLGIDRIATDSLDLPASRPRFSVLDCGRAAALGVRLPDWQVGLGAYLASPAGEALLCAAREGV